MDSSAFPAIWQKKEAVLQRMMARIVHRGPDMGGAYTDEDIALGFRRLSILDLSEAGAQPMKARTTMWSSRSTAKLYNFMELRRELEEKGHHFHCHADTECWCTAMRNGAPGWCTARAACTALGYGIRRTAACSARAI